MLFDDWGLWSKTGLRGKGGGADYKERIGERYWWTRRGTAAFKKEVWGDGKNFWRVWTAQIVCGKDGKYFYDPDFGDRFECYLWYDVRKVYRCIRCNFCRGRVRIPWNDYSGNTGAGCGKGKKAYGWAFDYKHEYVSVMRFEFHCNRRCWRLCPVFWRRRYGVLLEEGTVSSKFF